MKFSFGTRDWRSLMSVVAAGVFACSLQVQGAPAGQGRSQDAGVPPLKKTVRVFPPVNAYSVETVIRREGLGAVPLSLDFEGTGSLVKSRGISILIYGGRCLTYELVSYP